MAGAKKAPDPLVLFERGRQGMLTVYRALRDEDPAVQLAAARLAVEAAAQLDVPVARIQTWLQDGVLPGTKVSQQWRVPAVAVAELERSGRLRGRSRRLDPRYRG